MAEEWIVAPEINATSWLNSEQPLSLHQLRGQVVVLHAFQMLCPGCVMHGTPQAARIAETFADAALQVIGLHTVFEHHQVMTPAALEVFVSEYRLTFPIAFDLPAENSPLPVTMQKLGLQGTPSLVLIDKQGRIRMTHFGVMGDLALGGEIGRLLAES